MAKALRVCDNGGDKKREWHFRAYKDKKHEYWLQHILTQLQAEGNEDLGK